MALARSPSSRSERGARSGALLARHKAVSAAGPQLLAAFMALTVIPIVCAPLIVDEHWPAAAGYQGLLVGGLVLTLVGIVVVSHHQEGVVPAYARRL